MIQRVLWTIPCVDIVKTGGIRYHTEVLNFLSENGWNVVVFSLPIDSSQSRIKRNLVSNFRIAIVLFPVIQPGDVVVQNSGDHGKLLLINVLIRLLRSARIVAICHHLSHHDLAANGDFRVAAFKSLDRWVEGLFFRTVQRIVAVSRTTKRDITVLGIPSHKVSIVPNGIDRPPSVPVTRDTQRLHLLFVGCLGQRKGLEYLITAMRQLREERVVLHIVGSAEDETYFRYLQNLVRQWALENEVAFHGMVTQEALWRFYAEADIFVFPSLWEGFGIVLLEAMAFGLPVVATRAGAIPELVDDGENGLLVLPADSDALAAAIARLIEDPSLRERLGRNGRARYEENLTWEQVGETFAAVLIQVMAYPSSCTRRQRR